MSGVDARARLRNIGRSEVEVEVEVVVGRNGEGRIGMRD